MFWPRVARAVSVDVAEIPGLAWKDGLEARAGHSKPSMSLDVYTHVMPVAEVADERFLSLLMDEGR